MPCSQRPLAALEMTRIGTGFSLLSSKSDEIDDETLSMLPQVSSGTRRYHRQFDQGGPQVLVKHTFLDVEDVLPPRRQRRAITEPSFQKESESSDDDIYEDEPTEAEGFSSEDRDSDSPTIECSQPLSVLRGAAHSTTLDQGESIEQACRVQGVRLAQAIVGPTNSVMPHAGPMVVGVPAPGSFGAPVQVGTMMVMMPFPMPPSRDTTGQHVCPVGSSQQSCDAPALSDTRLSSQTVCRPALCAADSAPREGARLQPQTIVQTSTAGGRCQLIRWAVDARKLRGNDKQAVSPPFELQFGFGLPCVTFKMIIYPRARSSFKKAGGKGFVQLKCETEIPEATANLSYRLSVGDVGCIRAMRGPVSHNFAASAVTGVTEEEWDFAQAVDQTSLTFIIGLEITTL